MSKKVIIVLGMHRSGTSAVTRGLKALGVELGNNLMPPVANNNETGFWEDLDLNSLNEEILALVGSNWNSSRLIEPDELTVQSFSSLRLHAIDMLKRKIGKSDRFGMKNPRMCKTLPFWQQVIDHCDDVEDQYVIVVRNPLSVARSLAARDGFCTEKSYLLWLGHVIPTMTRTEGKPRVVIDYDLLMDDPFKQMERLASALGIVLDKNVKEELSNFAAGFLAQELRHTRFNPRHLALDSHLPTLAADAYRHLLNLAQDIVPLNDPTCIETWHRIDGVYSSMAPVYELLDREERMLAERERQIECLDQAISAREDQIAALGEAVADRDGQIIALDEAIADRDGKIVALGKAAADHEEQILAQEKKISALGEIIVDRDNQIVKLNDSVLDRDKHINQILGSNSWRLTSPLRALRRFPNTFFQKFSCFKSNMFRFIWRRLPIQIEKKIAIKNALFHNFPKLFSRTSAYRAWQSYNSSILETADNVLDIKTPDADSNILYQRYENSRTTISVYVPYNFIPQTFGGGVRILNVYERLSNNYNVNLIGLVGYGERFQLIELNEYCTVYLVPMSKEYYDLLCLEQQKAGGLLHDILISNEYKMIPDLIDLSNQLKNETDIFISAQPYFFKMFLEFFNDKILIYEAQNVDYELKRTYFQHPDTNGSAKHYLDMVREVELLACQKSEYILGVSGEDIDDLCKIYNVERSKIVMVPNGIDVHACHYISPDERKRNKIKGRKRGKQVVFIGSAHGPNIESVQYILNEIAAQNSSIHYTIIGNVNIAFEEKRIPQNVHFTGMISEEEKKEIYRTADLAINPMFSGSGTNLKVLEYIACGIPLLSTKFGMRGLELFNNYIYIAQKKDFWEAIEKTLSLPAEILENNSKEARKICEENFDKSVISDGLKNIIKKTEEIRKKKKKKVNIAIEGRILHRNVSGSERYIYELIKNLPTMHQECDYKYCLVNKTGFKLNGISNIHYISLSDRVDLYHRTYQVSNYNELLELLSAKRSIFTFLDLILCKNPDYFEKKDNYNNYVTLMNLALNYADRIIAISEHAKGDVAKTFNISEEKIDVVYLGIDLNKFKKVNDKKEINDFKAEYNLPNRYLLYIGTDYPHKNLKNLFIAFSKIMHLPEMRDYSLVMAGNNSYIKGPGYLNTYLEPIKHRVISLGYFADEKIPLLYNASDICVLPSLYEGFGLTVLEAFACGVPLICSDATSLPEVAGDAAYMVDAKDPDQIVKAIMDIAKDTHLKNMLINKGLKRVKQFSWEKCAEETHNVYKKALLEAHKESKANEKSLILQLSKLIESNMSSISKTAVRRFVGSIMKPGI